MSPLFSLPCVAPYVVYIQRLDGKVAIITGAASGIGEAAARLFVDNGAYVIVADIQDELGDKVVASIGSVKCCYKHCDVSKEEDVKEVVSHALEKCGRLDIFFNNAGVVGPANGIMDLDLKDLDCTMAVNFRGAVATIKHTALAMVAHKTRGTIICTSSIAASLGGLGPHAYMVSKHALVGLVKSTAAELGKHGIRVNCVSPYAVATNMACSHYKVGADELEAQAAAISNLKGIILKAKNIAEAALFLASDESTYISGHDLVVDGGFSVVNHGFHTYQ